MQDIIVNQQDPVEGDHEREGDHFVCKRCRHASRMWEDAERHYVEDHGDMLRISMFYDDGEGIMRNWYGSMAYGPLSKIVKYVLDHAPATYGDASYWPHAMTKEWPHFVTRQYTGIWVLKDKLSPEGEWMAMAVCGAERDGIQRLFRAEGEMG